MMQRCISWSGCSNSLSKMHCFFLSKVSDTFAPLAAECSAINSLSLAIHHSVWLNSDEEGFHAQDNGNILLDTGIFLILRNYETKAEIYCFINSMTAKYRTYYIIIQRKITYHGISFAPNERYTFYYSCLGWKVLFGPEQYLSSWTKIDVSFRMKQFHERQYFVQLWYKIVHIWLS
jgi:hypothetical protein